MDYLQNSGTQELSPVDKPQFIAILKAHISDLEDYLKTVEQVDCPIENYFAPGIYTRKMFIPADTFIIGKIHRTRHLNMMVTGTARIMIDGEVKEFDAGNHPLLFMSEAGSKKVGYHPTDTIFITQHPIAELTDEKILELESDQDYAERFVEDLETKLTYSRKEELEMIKQEIERLA